MIVAHHNQIVMEETLERALDRLFPVVDGGGAQAPHVAVDVDEVADRPARMDDALTARALEHYRRALQAQRDGNWAQYGEEIRRLGEVLERPGK